MVFMVKWGGDSDSEMSEDDVHIKSGTTYLELIWMIHDNCDELVL